MTLSLAEIPDEPNKRLVKAVKEANLLQKHLDRLSFPRDKAIKDVKDAPSIDNLISDASGITNFLDQYDQKNSALQRMLAAQDRVDKSIHDAFGKERSALEQMQATVDRLDKDYLDLYGHKNSALKQMQATQDLVARFSGLTDSLSKYNKAIAATGNFDRLQVSIAQSLELERIVRVPESLSSYFDLSTLSFLNPFKEMQAAAASHVSTKWNRAILGQIDVEVALQTLGAQSAFLALTGAAEFDSMRRAVESMSSLTRTFEGSVWENLSDDAEEQHNAGEIITQAISEVQALPHPTLADLVESAVDAYMRSTNMQARSWFEKYGFPLLIAFITVVLAPITSVYVTKALAEQTTTPTTEKEVRQGALEAGLNAATLAEYRFVSGQALAVRTTRRSNARAIATLKFGQPVRLLKKEGDWSLVEWTDKENDASIQGWVLSRYLRKFG
jgi:hypothetical protein